MRVRDIDTFFTPTPRQKKHQTRSSYVELRDIAVRKHFDVAYSPYCFMEV